ncbi:MAG: stage V sporulation T C-terminal domain-containing protein [Lachnospiraceae bacterium]|nr:stage V sporulation T C-terminal domain-containing protein [Lachnospiraceae bacterium]
MTQWDDLGRIVIPKEIRRTLRIREGDPLKIFTGHEGEIMLKKYSPVGELGGFTKEYAESLAQVSGMIVLITDRDQFVAAAGGYKNVVGKSITRELEDKMEKRETILAGKGERGFISVVEGMENDYLAEAIAPILCEGDVIGTVLLLTQDAKTKMGEAEQRLIQSAAAFLGKQMEQ